MSKSSAQIWFRRIIEIAWLFVLAICIVEVIVNLSNGETTKALIFAGFGAVAAFMFTFRLKQRRKFENKSK
jgi:hypothetical protein